MLRLAANLTTLFQEADFLDRFERASQAGFRTVEFLFPYAYSVGEIQSRIEAFGQSVELINLPPGNRDNGDWGLAALPDREAEFRETVHTALDYALPLKIPKLHCMSGVSEKTGAAARVYAKNLQYAADQCRRHEILLLIEPISPLTIPDTF